MALPEIGLLSMTPQPHHPNQPNSTTWMWNPREEVIAAEDEESWEVRAFAEDTRNMMNTTWPPRSYTCTFCHREFRSAQALGGHMNVHRRDRARLHQLHPTASSPSSSSSSSSSFIVPPNAAGLCLLYHLPTAPNSATFPSPPPPPPLPLSACGNSPSTLLSYPPNSFDFPVVSSHSPPTIDMSSYCNSAKLELPCNGHEELDLELRLGHRPN